MKYPGLADFSSEFWVRLRIPVNILITGFSEFPFGYWSKKEFGEFLSEVSHANFWESKYSEWCILDSLLPGTPFECISFLLTKLWNLSLSFKCANPFKCDKSLFLKRSKMNSEKWNLTRFLSFRKMADTKEKSEHRVLALGNNWVLNQ